MDSIVFCCHEEGKSEEIGHEEDSEDKFLSPSSKEAKPSSYCPSSTTPRVALYLLQLDVVKHLVKLSPVGAVLACVFGNCILYGGNDYSSTMSGLFTDGLGSIQKHDADRLFFEFALDQSKRLLLSFLHI